MIVTARFRCASIERQPPQLSELGDTARVTLLASSINDGGTIGRLELLVLNPVALAEFVADGDYEVLIRRLVAAD